MRAVLVVVVVFVVAGCGGAATVLAASEPPSATALAQRGSFKLVARALLHSTGPTGELKAPPIWLWKFSRPGPRGSTAG